jgi:hypothetical protein
MPTGGISHKNTGLKKGGHMSYHPLEVAPHLFASMLNKNDPALPLRAKSPAAAISKIAAAGTLLQAMLEAERSGVHYSMFLAREWISKKKYYTLPEEQRWGIALANSGSLGTCRRYAMDAGGYYGSAVRAAVDYEFSLNELDSNERMKAGKIMTAAFPATWEAILSLTHLGYGSEEYIRNKFAKALLCEWDTEFLLGCKNLTYGQWEVFERRYAGMVNSDEYDPDDIGVVSVRIHNGYLYVYRRVCHVDNAPCLEPDNDGEWHFVGEPHRVKCTVGVGWYVRVSDDKESQIIL